MQHCANWKMGKCLIFQILSNSLFATYSKVLMKELYPGICTEPYYIEGTDLNNMVLYD